MAIFGSVTPASGTVLPDGEAFTIVLTTVNDVELLTMNNATDGNWMPSVDLILNGEAAQDYVTIEQTDPMFPGFTITIARGTVSASDSPIELTFYAESSNLDSDTLSVSYTVEGGGTTDPDPDPDPEPGTGVDLIAYTDPVLEAGMKVKAVHMTELQTNVNALRAAHGISAYSFPTITAMETSLSKWQTHVQQMRFAITAVSLNHEAWIAFSHRPTAAIIMQLRNVVASLAQEVNT